jgi:hypothetical protein
VTPTALPELIRPGDAAFGEQLNVKVLMTLAITTTSAPRVALWITGGPATDAKLISLATKACAVVVPIQSRSLNPKAIAEEAPVLGDS